MVLKKLASHLEKIELDPSLILNAEYNSRGIHKITTNVKPGTVKVIGEKRIKTFIIQEKWQSFLS